MKCPVCHELMMVLELEKVEIDYCVLCRGIWLDEGELEMLLESAGQKNRFLKSLSPETGISEKKIRCPVCRKKMDKISFLAGPGNGSSESVDISGQDARTKIIVDGCPRYHGIWFDRGELSQALAGGGLSENHKIYRLLEQVFTERNVE
jgi:Zn-finger nucleic acid-binding protein